MKHAIITAIKFFILGNYKVNSIEINSPFKAKTHEGIILGQSTREDIINKYGKPSEEILNQVFYNKNNITFILEEDKNKVFILKKIRFYGTSSF